MKFRNGMWLFREDISASFAEDIYAITPSEAGDALSLLCPVRAQHTRGNTLNMPVVTVELRAEFDDVISVTATHWKGARAQGPAYPLFPDGRPPAARGGIQTTPAGDTVLTAGRLAATVSGAPHSFGIRFDDAHSGERVTSLDARSVGFAYSPAPSSAAQLADTRGFRHWMFTQHALGVGEGVFGLGERFTALNRVGQAVALYNADGGTSSEQAYKNVPFYLTSRGYGVFLDHAEPVELEVGSERTCRVQASVEGHALRWFLIYGPTPKDVLRKYCVLTGRPPLLPAWASGLWLSTSFTTSYDEATVGAFLDGMHARGIPVHVFHYDCFWMRAFHWCDFVFDRQMFPDPKGMMARLKAKFPGLRFCVWINPYLGDASPVFAEAAAKGYLLKRRNGDVWQWDLWQAGMGLLDITNPAARAWYAAKLNGLFDLGVDCVKTDFGERIPDADVAWHDPGVSPAKMHNYYALAYNELCFATARARFGAGQAVLFARAATAGSQRFPVHWGGDCESTYEAMAESLRGGLSLGLSGFAHWSVDIGGFEGTPPPGVYKRWVAFGLLCSHSRLHGSDSYRVPWSVDDEAADVLRAWVALKLRLLPYVAAHAAQAAADSGLPVSLRAMLLEFPDDPTAWFLDRQFMLGDALLAAPVFADDGRVSFYLPAGRWTSWWDGAVVDGPGWRTETHGFATCPLYVRGGSLLVLGREGETRAEYDYARDVEIRAFSPGPGAEWRSARVVDAQGADLGVLEMRDGKVAVPETLSRWRVTVDGTLTASSEDEPEAKAS